MRKNSHCESPSPACGSRVASEARRARVVPMARSKESLFRRLRAGPSSGSLTLATFSRRAGEGPDARTRLKRLFLRIAKGPRRGRRGRKAEKGPKVAAALLNFRLSAPPAGYHPNLARGAR